MINNNKNVEIRFVFWNNEINVDSLITNAETQTRLCVIDELCRSRPDAEIYETIKYSDHDEPSGDILGTQLLIYTLCTSF